MWCMLPESVKNCWIEAGKTINTYDELSKTIPNKVSKFYYICIQNFVWMYNLFCLLIGYKA